MANIIVQRTGQADSASEAMRRSKYLCSKLADEDDRSVRSFFHLARTHGSSESVVGPQRPRLAPSTDGKAWKMSHVIRHVGAVPGKRRANLLDVIVCLRRIHRLGDNGDGKRASEIQNGVRLVRPESGQCQLAASVGPHGDKQLAGRPVEGKEGATCLCGIRPCECERIAWIHLYGGCR